jgi:AraC-like DNA-binding protein
MTETLPLTRAAALGPFLVWMRDHGRSIEEALQGAGLPLSISDEPNRSIPLRLASTFIRDFGRREGPDSICRVVEHAGLAPMGLVGAIATAARTPRQAFLLISRAFAQYGSHGLLTFEAEPGGGTVRHAFRVRLDVETLHYCQQFVAALIRCVAMGMGRTGPLVSRVAMTPHPVFGLSTLNEHFGCEPFPAKERTLAVTMPDAVLDRPYLRPKAASLDPRPWEGLSVIRGDGTLVGSIRTVLPGLIEQRAATLETVADLAFMSRRTLQRRLAGEGTSLAKLIDEARAAMTMALLQNDARPISLIAADVGYASNTGLTHAVRRWTNASPSKIRGKDKKR